MRDHIDRTISVHIIVSCISGIDIETLFCCRGSVTLEPTC